VETSTRPSKLETKVSLCAKPVEIVPQKRGSVKLSYSDPETIKCTCPRGNCKKKYCVCLKAGMPCDPSRCGCTDCENDNRLDAHHKRTHQLSKLSETAVRRGCNCKRNQCKLNYCVCFAQSLQCDPNFCFCESCANLNIEVC